MTSIYLDDFRIPEEHPHNGVWLVVRDHDEFVETVTEIGLSNIDIISLDHDLDESSTQHYFNHVKEHYEIDYSQITEKTGLDVAKWLISHSTETNTDLPKCYIHSHNPIGSGKMLGYLNLYLKKCRKPENCEIRRWKYTK